MRWTICMCLGITACASPPLTVAEGAVPEAPGLALECMSAVVHGDMVHVIGLDGAAEGGVVHLASATGDDLGTTIVDEHGRFTADVVAQAGDIVAVATEADPDTLWPLRVRDASVELAHPPLTGGAGSQPNDLVVLPDGRAVLVRSGDDALVVFDPQSGSTSGVGIRLPEGERAAVPWFVVAVDAHTVAVSSQGRHLIYLVDIDAGAVTDVLEPPPPLALTTPFVLSRPFDVDGDGRPESTIDHVPARAPQGLAVSGDRIVVGYSGFLAAATGPSVPAVFVPGVLASWSLSDRTRPPVVVQTPALDPQELRPLDDGSILVTLSGAVGFARDGHVETSSGAVWQVDATTLMPRALWPLGDFGPTTSVIAADTLWVASLSRARVRALALDGGALIEELALNTEAIDSVFRWVELPCGLLGAPSYDTDRIHVIDPRTRQLSPAPFLAPIVVGPGRPVFAGLQVVARRPGRPGRDFVGPDLYVLASAASRITPVELRRILGP